MHRRLESKCPSERCCFHLQTDENEVRNIFNSQPGFRQIKLNRGQRGITCFVEFSDVASAMAVHQSQQVRLGAGADIFRQSLLFSSQEWAVRVNKIF